MPNGKMVVDNSYRKRRWKILMIRAYIMGLKTEESENIAWNQQKEIPKNNIPDIIKHANLKLQSPIDLSYFINKHIQSGYETMLATDTNHTIKKLSINKNTG